jgi:hypothetical protein
MLTLRLKSLLALSAGVLLGACDPIVGGDDDGTTSGGPDTTTGIDPVTSGSPPATTTPIPGTSGTGDPTTGNPATGGPPGDCVDVDIASAVGDGVVTASNAGLSDDFSLRFCSGGYGTGDTGFGTTGDTFGTGDPTTGFGTTGFGTSGFGSSSTGFGSDTDGPGVNGGDFVVSWTPPSTGSFVIDTNGSSMDTVLSVVPPVCGAASSTCNDDCQGLRSGLVFQATEGETVYIVIEGYAGRRGSFVLNITEGNALDCGSWGTSTGYYGSSSGGFATSTAG